MSQSILVIEDDRKLQDLLREYLGSFGYRVRTEGRPEAGLKAFASDKPNLVILDVMLPDMNGFEVCRVVRQQSDVPVIMLTARGDVMDRIAGLEIGADDYLQKPFEPRELVARIQSVLRRSRPDSTPPPRSFSGLRIDFEARTATLDGRDLDLTTNEYEALVLLVRNAGKVMDRDALLQGLRGLESDAFSRAVDIAMSRLRQKLGDDPKKPRFIKTVWGSGYAFIAKADADA